MYIQYSSCLFALLLAACSRNETVGPELSQPVETMTSTEYAVLFAVIDSLYDPTTVTQIVVQDSTTPEIYAYNLDSVLTTTLGYVRQTIPSLGVEAAGDFKTKNLVSSIVRDSASLHPKSRLLNTAIAWHILRGDSGWSWNAFSLMYPGAHGFLSVGRVGIDKNGSQALAYVGSHPGSRSGAGFYFVLSFENGKWKVVGRALASVS